jgi:hypothetical protein
MLFQDEKKTPTGDLLFNLLNCLAVDFIRSFFVNVLCKPDIGMSCPPASK